MNVVEGGVEILLKVVVKHTWLTVVLGHHGNERADVHGFHFALVVVVFARSSQSGSISNSFLFSLRRIFPLFDGEVVDRVISRVVTPVGTEFDGISLLLKLSALVEFVCPGHTAAEVVPVHVSVDNNVAEGSPAPEAELADLPDIRLPHVIRYVEHHINYNYFYIIAQSVTMYAATKGKNEKITGLDGQVVQLEQDFEDMMRKRDEEKRKLELKFKDVYQ